jgi:hypothetical protein
MSGTSVAGRYLRDAGMSNGYEQPVNWARIVVLVAVALPVFGSLCYALLDFLLFESSCHSAPRWRDMSPGFPKWLDLKEPIPFVSEQ